MEIWRAIPAWEGLYEVSNKGRVRSLARIIRVLNPWGVMAERRFAGRVLKLGASKNGYLRVNLAAPDRGVVQRYVHDLVTETFIGPKPDGLEVCHNDGVRTNCCLENLRYDTRSNNALDRHLHGTMNQASYLGKKRQEAHFL